VNRMTVDLSNSKFLNVVFYGATTWVTGFKDDPQSEGGGKWKGQSFLTDDEAPACIEDPANNTFFSICSLKSIEGQVHRLNDNFSALHVVVLDDIGTKVSREVIVLEPSYRLKTSVKDGVPNYQIGYLLDVPCADLGKAKSLISKLTKNGFASDAGMGGVNRYARLPVGSNTKAAYGRPIRHELETFDSDLRYSMDEIAEAYEIDLHETGCSNDRDPFFDDRSGTKEWVTSIVTGDNYHDATLRLSEHFDLSLVMGQNHTGLLCPSS